jgi:hypothetical protein
MLTAVLGYIVDISLIYKAPAISRKQASPASTLSIISAAKSSGSGRFVNHHPIISTDQHPKVSSCLEEVMVFG